MEVIPLAGEEFCAHLLAHDAPDPCEDGECVAVLTDEGDVDFGVLGDWKCVAHKFSITCCRVNHNLRPQISWSEVVGRGLLVLLPFLSLCPRSDRAEVGEQVAVDDCAPRSVRAGVVGVGFLAVLEEKVDEFLRLLGEVLVRCCFHDFIMTCCCPDHNLPVNVSRET